MVDQVLELAQHAGRAIEARPELELLTTPSTVMVAFRHRGGDDVNIRIHRDLFASGEAVIGRTRVDGTVALKLTLLNPLTTPADIDALLDDDRQRGSLTGSFTVAQVARRVADAAGDPDRLDRAARLGGQAQAQREHVRPPSRERLTCGPLSVRLERRRAVSRTTIEQSWSQESRTSVRRRRSSRGVARALRNGGAPDGDGRLDRAGGGGARDDEDRDAHGLGLRDAVADPVARRVSWPV